MRPAWHFKLFKLSSLRVIGTFSGSVVLIRNLPTSCSQIWIGVSHSLNIGAERWLQVSQTGGVTMTELSPKSRCQIPCSWWQVEPIRYSWSTEGAIARQSVLTTWAQGILQWMQSMKDIVQNQNHRIENKIVETRGFNTTSDRSEPLMI